MTVVSSSLFVLNFVVGMTCLLGIAVVALLGPFKEEATKAAPAAMKVFQQGVSSAVDALERLLASLKGNVKGGSGGQQQTGFLDANPAEIRSEMSNIRSAVFHQKFQSGSTDAKEQEEEEQEHIEVDENDPTLTSASSLSFSHSTVATPAKGDPVVSTSEGETDSEVSPMQAAAAEKQKEAPRPAQDSTDAEGGSHKSKISMIMLDSSVSLQLQSAVSRKSKYGTAIHPVEFRKFRVTKVGKITSDSVRIRFAIPENKKLEIPLGRHVVVQATINGQVVRRSYTPITRADLPGCFDLVVKGYEFGKMSSFLQKMSAMDEVDIRGPIGNFNYRMNTYKHICLLAGGTGLTPCLQVLTSVLEMPEYQHDNTFFTLLYQARTEEDILLLHELRSLHQKYNKRLTIAFFVSSPAHESWGDRIGQVRGCISEDYLKKIQSISPQPDMYCVAGPSGFNSRVENTLRDIDDTKGVFVF
jgi:ferredoxin-NADP reductase